MRSSYRPRSPTRRSRRPTPWGARALELRLLGTAGGALVGAGALAAATRLIGPRPTSAQLRPGTAAVVTAALLGTVLALAAPPTAAAIGGLAAAAAAPAVLAATAARTGPTQRARARPPWATPLLGGLAAPVVIGGAVDGAWALLLALPVAAAALGSAAVLGMRPVSASPAGRRGLAALVAAGVVSALTGALMTSYPPAVGALALGALFVALGLLLAAALVAHPARLAETRWTLAALLPPLAAVAALRLVAQAPGADAGTPLPLPLAALAVAVVSAAIAIAARRVERPSTVDRGDAPARATTTMTTPTPTPAPAPAPRLAIDPLAVVPLAIAVLLLVSMLPIVAGGQAALAALLGALALGLAVGAAAPIGSRSAAAAPGAAALIGIGPAATDADAAAASSAAGAAGVAGVAGAAVAARAAGAAAIGALAAALGAGAVALNGGPAALLDARSPDCSRAPRSSASRGRGDPRAARRGLRTRAHRRGTLPVAGWAAASAAPVALGDGWWAVVSALLPALVAVPLALQRRSRPRAPLAVAAASAALLLVPVALLATRLGHERRADRRLAPRARRRGTRGHLRRADRRAGTGARRPPRAPRPGRDGRGRRADPTDALVVDAAAAAARRAPRRCHRGRHPPGTARRRGQGRGRAAPRHGAGRLSASPHPGGAPGPGAQPAKVAGAAAFAGPVAPLARTPACTPVPSPAGAPARSGRKRLRSPEGSGGSTRPCSPPPRLSSPCSLLLANGAESILLGVGAVPRCRGPRPRHDGRRDGPRRRWARALAAAVATTRAALAGGTCLGAWRQCAGHRAGGAQHPAGAPRAPGAAAPRPRIPAPALRTAATATSITAAIAALPAVLVQLGGAAAPLPFGDLLVGLPVVALLLATFAASAAPRLPLGIGVAHLLAALVATALTAALLIPDLPRGDAPPGEIARAVLVTALAAAPMLVLLAPVAPRPAPPPVPLPGPRPVLGAGPHGSRPPAAPPSPGAGRIRLLVIAGIVGALALMLIAAGLLPRIPALAIEAFTAPYGIALAVVGLVLLRRRPGLHSWPALGPALGALLGIGLIAELVEPSWWRIGALTLLVVAALVGGAVMRLQAPIVAGAAIGLAHGVIAVRRVLPDLAVPWWVWLAAAGALLVLFAASYEARKRDAQRLATAVRALR